VKFLCHQDEQVTTKKAPYYLQTLAYLLGSIIKASIIVPPMKIFCHHFVGKKMSRVDPMYELVKLFIVELFTVDAFIAPLVSISSPRRGCTSMLEYTTASNLKFLNQHIMIHQVKNVCETARGQALFSTSKNDTRLWQFVRSVTRPAGHRLNL